MWRHRGTILGRCRRSRRYSQDGDAAIVTADETGSRSLQYARWGWKKVRFRGKKHETWLTNVRNLDGWPWQHVISERSQRCLVPASSFSEYHPSETIPGARGTPIKAASWFRLQGEAARPPFAFAGMMRRWGWEQDGLRKKADEALRDAGHQVTAMAFLTTEPNSIVAPIHPKAMPVVLHTEEQFETWLIGTAEDAASLQKPLPNELLELAFTGGKQDPRRTVDRTGVESGSVQDRAVRSFLRQCVVKCLNISKIMPETPNETLKETRRANRLSLYTH
ncbi:SOS response-associated peptidase family protein [Ruegeria sp. ANG-R]|uniref:SOS response-associated peptidase family protein n=1 Tax=Ruegeria sp. ANG-R TaxID=1577903 RepID=UPI00068B1474|nr:SOS response-associated peptidase family protein [Ruegeria sp. ANG-R]